MWENILQYISLNENVWIFIRILLIYVSKYLIGDL